MLCLFLAMSLVLDLSGADGRESKVTKGRMDHLMVDQAWLQMHREHA